MLAMHIPDGFIDGPVYGARDLPAPPRRTALVTGVG